MDLLNSRCQINCIYKQDLNKDLDQGFFSDDEIQNLEKNSLTCSLNRCDVFNNKKYNPFICQDLLARNLELGKKLQLHARNQGRELKEVLRKTTCHGIC